MAHHLIYHVSHVMGDIGLVSQLWVNHVTEAVRTEEGGGAMAERFVCTYMYIHTYIHTT